jgi:hypothetical protein
MTVVKSIATAVGVLITGGETVLRNAARSVQRLSKEECITMPLPVRLVFRMEVAVVVMVVADVVVAVVAAAAGIEGYGWHQAKVFWTLVLPIV